LQKKVNGDKYFETEGVAVFHFKFMIANMLPIIYSTFMIAIVWYISKHRDAWLSPELSAVTTIVWHVSIFTFFLQESINSSLLNLLTYPWIKKRVNEGTLNLHGGYYNFIDCTFEKWTLVYREGLEGGSKYAIKNRSTWSWPMKALFTWVNFTLPPVVQHGFALPLRCSFSLHLAPLCYWCSAEGSPCINELLHSCWRRSMVAHGTMPLAWHT
jgi:hypothetical protein